jgi:dynein heavy chain 1
VNLQKNEAVVKDIILVAQGEMALEEFLKQVCNLMFTFRSFLHFV